MSKTETITLRVSPEFKERLKQWSEWTALSQSAILETAFKHLIHDAYAVVKCPKCETPTMILAGLLHSKVIGVTCNTCNHEFSYETDNPPFEDVSVEHIAKLGKKVSQDLDIYSFAINEAHRIRQNFSDPEDPNIWQQLAGRLMFEGPGVADDVDPMTIQPFAKAIARLYLAGDMSHPQNRRDFSELMNHLSAE